jgi:hypothetical protein
MQATLYPSLPKLLSPPPSQQQKTLTPSTPIQQIATPTSLMKSSPSSIGTLRARAHNFISRNILIPETCCVVCRKKQTIFLPKFDSLFLLVSQTYSFWQISLSLSSMQCSVSYGLQRKLCNTLFT